MNLTDEEKQEIMRGFASLCDQGYDSLSPPEIKTLFDKLGITKEDLKDSCHSYLIK